MITIYDGHGVCVERDHHPPNPSTHPPAPHPTHPTRPPKPARARCSGWASSISVYNRLLETRPDLVEVGGR